MSMQCPHCESSHVQEKIILDTFRYGIGPEPVLIGVKVPLLFCLVCDGQWTDYRAEELRQAAVDEYLRTGIAP